MKIYKWSLIKSELDKYYSHLNDITGKHKRIDIEIHNKYYIYWIHKKCDDDMYNQGYVGISYDPINRYKSHSRNRKSKIGIELQHNIDKYIFDIIGEGSLDEVLALERLYRSSQNIGLNVSIGGGGFPGIPSKESIEKGEGTKRSRGFYSRNKSDSVKKSNMTKQKSGYFKSESYSKARKKSAKTRVESGFYKSEKGKLIGEKISKSLTGNSYFKSSEYKNCRNRAASTMKSRNKEFNSPVQITLNSGEVLVFDTYYSAADTFNTEARYIKYSIKVGHRHRGGRWKRVITKSK